MYKFEVNITQKRVEVLSQGLQFNYHSKLIAVLIAIIFYGCSVGFLLESYRSKFHGCSVGLLLESYIDLNFFVIDSVACDLHFQTCRH